MMKRARLVSAIAALLCTQLGCTAICDDSAGSCMALTVEGSGEFTRLVVRSLYKQQGGELGDSLATALQPLDALPQVVRIVPPPEFSASSMQRLAVEAINDRSGEQVGGSLALQWGDGEHQRNSVQLTARFLRRDVPVANTTRELRVADLDRDGRLDVIVAFQENQLGIFHGAGDGSFDGYEDPYTVVEPNGLSIGDINKDGNLDIICASNKLAQIAVLYGGGTLASFHNSNKNPMYTSFAIPEVATTLELADV